MLLPWKGFKSSRPFNTPMKLSFLLPTFRTGPSAYASILNVCAMAGTDVEVIVRDNSGNEEKRRFLEQFQTEHCHIHHGEFCRLYDNLKESAYLAKGDFVFCVSDDDYVDPIALPAILQKIDAIAADPNYVGISGDFLYSGSKSTFLLNVPTLESPSPATRYHDFTKSYKNLLWSVHRRALYTRFITFIKTLPAEFSFHDMLFNVLMVMSGRYTKIDRVIYYKGITDSDNAARNDRGEILFLTRQGLDATIHRAYMLIYIVEGSKVILGTPLANDVPMSERMEIGRIWCARWFAIFRHNYQNYRAPAEPMTDIDKATIQVCEKWAHGNKIDIDEILADLVSLFALCNPGFAKKYHDFWSRYGKTITP